jgi:hypothetical protein
MDANSSMKLYVMASNFMDPEEYMKGVSHQYDELQQSSLTNLPS